MNLHIQKVLLTVAFGLLVLFSTCKRDDSVYIFPNTNTSPKLPEITSEGKNTYGCKVNDEVWVTNDFWADYGIDGALIVYAQKNNGNNIVSFKIKNLLTKTNPYRLLFKNTNEGNGGYFNNPYLYDLDSLHGGYLNLIRFDTINFIVSGTFNFKAFCPQNNTIIHITDGRFDIKYH